MPSDELLKIHLMTAVPLYIEQFRNLPWQEIDRIAKESSQIIAEKGDLIMFKGKKGESAKAVNALAKGIAALSFVPGGVKVFGLHFESRLEDLYRQPPQGELRFGE